MKQFSNALRLLGQWILISALASAAIALLLWAVQGVPEWQVRRASVRSTARNPEAQTTPEQVAALENEMRKTDIQGLGGALALVALFFTFRRLQVADQVHITDRFSKAIEQLGASTEKGAPNAEVRLGAIYALERIARDSARDHWTIMEVLTTYVRQNAPAPINVPTDGENQEAINRGPAKEVQAILTVLGRRRRSARRERGEQFLDLSHCDLRGASFLDAHLEESSLQHSHAQGADLRFAHAKGADFQYAHLEGATFTDAHLPGAILSGAHMARADFRNAHIERANLRFAHLEEAELRRANVKEADFVGAEGLNAEQVRAAMGWRKAQFDEAFSRELGLPPGPNLGTGRGQ